MPAQSVPDSAALVAAVADQYSVSSSLRGAARAVRDAVERQLLDPQPSSAHSDQVIDTLRVVVDGIKSGKSITENHDQIASLINNQEERAKLLDTLLLTHDYDRLVNFLYARKQLEQLLLSAAMRGDLTPTEQLAFMTIVLKETETISQRIRAGANSEKDIMSLLNKVDYTMQVSESDSLKKFKDTTPQGREIIRRAAYRIRKLAGQPSRDTVND